MITLKVNGQDHTYDGDGAVPLLWVLRDEFGLTGTKFGCGGGFAAPVPYISVAWPSAPVRSRWPTRPGSKS